MATIPSANPQLAIFDFPNFKPWYTPKEMLQLGVFGGNHFYLQSSRKDLPSELFEGLQLDHYRNDSINAVVNYFGIVAPMRSRNISEASKYLDYAGWFLWYTRFYYGRRHLVDLYRIKQFKDEVKNLSFYIINDGPSEERQIRLNDLENPNYLLKRQHLLQFAWDSTKDPVTFI